MRSKLRLFVKQWKVPPTKTNAWSVTVNYGCISIVLRQSQRVGFGLNNSIGLGKRAFVSQWCSGAGMRAFPTFPT